MEREGSIWRGFRVTRRGVRGEGVAGEEGEVLTVRRISGEGGAWRDCGFGGAGVEGDGGLPAALDGEVGAVARGGSADAETFTGLEEEAAGGMGGARG